jgi:hypothetical protein
MQVAFACKQRHYPAGSEQRLQSQFRLYTTSAYMQSDTTDTPNETNTKAIKELNTNPCLVLLISPNTKLQWRSLVTEERNSYGANGNICDFKNENNYTSNIFNSNIRSQRRLN